MAKVLPYYPMFVYDFDESERVLAMNISEVGLYLLSMNHAWKKGSIPDDPEEVARLIRKKAADVKKAWPQVRGCFVESAPGRLVNERQEEEREKILSKSNQASRAVSERERKRIGRSTSTSSSDVSSDVSGDHLRAYGSGSVYVSSSKNTENDANENEPSFWSERLYSRHTKTGGKPLVEDWVCQQFAAWPDFAAKIADIDRVHALWCVTEDWRKDNGRYAPKLAQWLADDGWKREPKITEPVRKKSKAEIEMEEAMRS